MVATEGLRSLRSCEKIGWQAKAPAPQARKRLRIKVGQTLSSVNPALSAFLSRLLTVAARWRGVSTEGRASRFAAPSDTGRLWSQDCSRHRRITKHGESRMNSNRSDRSEERR